MPASIGYSDDKKKEYAGRFIGGALSFLIKKFGVPEEIANTVGDEFGGFVVGVELTDNRADTVEKHWGQALDRTWKQMRERVDLPDEFWEPLEEVLFQTPNTVELFLKSYREIQADDDSVDSSLDIYTHLDATIYDIHKDSEMIDVESLPKDFSKRLACSLKKEIKNDISLIGIVQYIVEKLNQGSALPIKESTKISLTTIPAAVDLIGRDRDNTAIKELLGHHPIVSIYADGGVGKTALALRIINDTKGEIDLGRSKSKHIAWIKSTGDLKNDLSALSIPGIKGEESIDDKFKAACTFLEINPTFLVIDNMDVPPSAEDINALNTISGSTKILITTRIKIKNSRQYPLERMDQQDAITLFYKHYLDVAEVPETDSRTDKVYVEKIVESASGNALLIELIAKMARWEYTDRLDDLWVKLEKDVFGTDSEIGLETEHADSHKSGALSEVDLKLQGQIRNLYRMSGLDDSKQELMRFIAAFPAETIIFADVFKWAGFKVQDLKYLTERGWIEKAGEGYLIHTMVQGSVILQKKELDIEKHENLIKELSDTDQYMPEGMVYTRVRERIVVPDSVCRFLIEIGSNKQETATLFHNIATVYQDQGEYEKALEYFRKALAIREKVLGAEHPSTATTYNNIAVVYWSQGEYEKSLGYYKKALAIDETVLGAEHPSTATTYNNIALVYQYQGDDDKALEYFRKALAIREKVLGAEHPSTATTYNNIAIVYWEQGEYEKSLEYFRKALAINEIVLGAEHPLTATTYNNIALVYQDQGDDDKALEYFRKALAIDEKVLGAEHPLTAPSYNNIATVYRAHGEYGKALEYFRKALAIDEKVLGAGHPSIATTYNNIAIVYRDQGEYGKALEYLRKALTIREKVLGAEHPLTAMTFHLIALVYQDQGKYEKALDYYKKALTISVKVLGAEHPSIATTYNNIAVVYRSQREYEKALEYFRKALAISVKVLGAEHLSIATTYNNIAVVYHDQGDYQESKEYIQKAYKIFLKILGDIHPKTKDAKELLDEVNQKLDQ